MKQWTNSEMFLSVPNLPARPVNAYRGREFNLSIVPDRPMNNSAPYICRSRILLTGQVGYSELQRLNHFIRGVN